jgi:hypothetical protein
VDQDCPSWRLVKRGGDDDDRTVPQVPSISALAVDGKD